MTDTDNTTQSLDGPTWSLELELPTWMAVPAAPSDELQWRADATRLFILLGEMDEAMPADLRVLSERRGFDADSRKNALDALLETAAALPEGQRLVAGLSVADRWPIPVVVRVNLTDDELEDLLEGAGARGGSPIEAPTVDYLPEELGDGITVTRFDLDDSGALWASVGCARRRDGVDTVLTWRTSDLALVPVFQPMLTSLLASVVVEGASS